MSTTIASASVRISADVADLRAEIEAGVRASLAGVDATVNVDADTAEADAKVAATDAELNRVAGKTVTAHVRVESSGVNEASRGFSTMTTAVATLGPAIVPLTAAVVGFAGSSVAAFGAVALGAGVVALAFKGIKDEVGGELDPAIEKLQETAAAGILPGVQHDIDLLLTSMPQVRNLVSNVSIEVGKLTTEAGDALTGRGFAAFFSYIDSSAVPIIDELGHTVGNVTEGVAHLVVAFKPVTDELGTGLESLSAKFASSTENSAGLQRFVGYIQTEGPQVVHTLEGVAVAAVHIGTSLAPVGDAVISLTHGFADIVTHTPGPIIEDLAVSFGAYVVASKAVTIATKVQTAALKVLGATEEEAAIATAGTTAALGPVAIALAALTLGYAAYEAQKRSAAAEGDADVAAANQYIASLNTVYSSQKSVADSTAQIQNRIHSLTGTLDSFGQTVLKRNQSITDLKAELNGAPAAGQKMLGTLIQVKQLQIGLDDLRHSSQVVQGTTRALGNQFGLTNKQVISLANSAHIDLSKGLAASLPAFAAVVSANLRTHHAMSLVNADVSVLTNRAASADAQLTALSDILDRLAGNALSADQANLAFKDDIDALNAALKHSHGSLNENTKAGNDAKQAFDTAAQQALAYAQSVEKQTGSVTKARAALKSSINDLKDAAGNSKAAQHGIDLLRSAYDKIPASTDKAAAGAKKGSDDIVKTVGQAAGAAVSAFLGHVSDAQTAGAEFAQGYASGIGNGESAVVSAAVALTVAAITAVKDTQQSHSPAKKTQDEGKNAADGYASGIVQNTPQAKKAARQMAEQSVAAIREYVSSTFASDLAGTPKQIRSGVGGLEYRLATADRRGYISTRERQSIDVELERTRKALIGVANASAKVSSELSKQTSRLSTLRSNAANVRSSAVSSFQGLGDPSQYEGITSVSGLLSLLGGDDRTAAAFDKNLATLRHDKLNKRAYNQLVAAGPGQDSQIAALLAGASKAQIREFNRREALLDTSGRRTGRASADYLFGRQIAAERTEVKALRHEQHQLNQDQHQLISLLRTYLKGGKSDERLVSAIRSVGHDVADALDGTAKNSHQKRRGTVRGAHHG